MCCRLAIRRGGIFVFDADNQELLPTMTFELAIVLGVTFLALVLFVTDAFPIEVVALLTLSVLFLTGILTAEEGLAGFSNEATVAIGAMFVLSEGLRQTGVLENLTHRLAVLFRINFRLGLAVMMIGTGTVSAFINNVAVVAVMLPVVLDMSKRLDVNPTCLLIPLSFAAMFGGSMTLIGTSSTLLVSGLIAERGIAPIGMFEVTPLGLVLFAVGLVYLLTIGQKLLPDRPMQEEWKEQFDRPEYRAQIELLPDHDAVGHPADTVLVDRSDVRIIAVFRDGQIVEDDIEEIIVEPHDVLRVTASARVIGRFDQADDVNVVPLKELVREGYQREMEELELFQVVIAPSSGLVGKTLRDADFDVHHPVLVVALRRAGEVLIDELLDVELHGGEILLLEAPAEERRRLQQSEDFIVVSEVPAERFKKKLLLPVLLIFGAIVALAGFGVLPIVKLAIAGAVAMVLFGALSITDAYRAIDWQVIFLLGGFIPLGTALEKVGAVELIAQGLVGALGGYGPIALLAGFYFTTTFMSDLISNQATAVLITPVAIATAVSLGVDPRPFVIAIAFAAANSFASPIGYHTNVMIYGAGNYRYLDFVKVGLPLNLLFLATAVVVLPMIWSF